MDFPTFQNIDKEIIWGDEMMGCMLLLMSLTIYTRKITISMRVHQNLNEILIMFNEKPIIQISKIITHDVSLFLDKISFY
jgi:hypothetical protein